MHQFRRFEHGTLVFRFRSVRAHFTSQCRKLQHHIQDLIDRGLLQEYVKKEEKTENPAPNSAERLPAEAMKSVQKPNPVTGNIIGVIHASVPTGVDCPTQVSKKEQERMDRMMQRRDLQERLVCQTEERVVDHTLADPRSLIVFSDQDLVGVRNPHYDALVIAIQIGDYTVRKVMIDGSSGADILFYPAFFAMGKSKEDLNPASAPLVGFNGMASEPVGEVMLPVRAGDILLMTRFLVMDVPSLYNAILGRWWIHEMKAIPSTYHRFPTQSGMMEIKGELSRAKKCQMIARSQEHEEGRRQDRIGCNIRTGS